MVSERHARPTQNNEEEILELQDITGSEHTDIIMPTHPESHLSLLGITFAFLSAFSASVMGMFVKLATTVPAFEVTFIRSIVAVVFILPVLLYYRTTFIYPKRKSLLLLGRGLTGTVSVLCKFYSIKRLPLGDATVIAFTTSIFAAFFGYIFLKESLHKIDALAAMLSLGGVLLAARPSFIFGSSGGRDLSKMWLPLLTCILGAMFNALSFIFLRKLGKVNANAVVLYFSLTMFLGSAVASMTDGAFNVPKCDTYDNWYLLLVGLSAISVQIFITRALALEKTVICALTRTSDIVFAFIWQISFFSLTPTLYSIGGALLIFMCNVVIFVKQYYMKNKLLR